MDLGNSMCYLLKGDCSSLKITRNIERWPDDDEAQLLLKLDPSSCMPSHYSTQMTYSLNSLKRYITRDCMGE